MALLLICFFLLLFHVSPAWPHDLWMIRENGRVLIRIGEDFPVPTNGLTADRIVFLLAVSPASTVSLEGQAEEKQYAAGLPAPLEGPVMVELEVKARFIKLAAADFNRYIQGEGLDHIVKARQSAGQSDAPGLELYSRYSKLLVDRPGDDRHFLAPRGHRLEIIPEGNPARLPAGATLVVRVLFEGKPLAGALVSAGPAGTKGHKFPTSGRTGADGRVRLAVTSRGWWYVRLIHMIPSTEPGADWRSFFGTLTLER